jgi:hypothetical protein
MTQTNHPFFNTLGPGPYKYIGYGHYTRNNGIDSKYIGVKSEGAEGHCVHCGQQIVHIYVVETAEGRRFGVGSDCIFKLNETETFAGMAEIEKHVKEMRNKQAKIRRERQLEGLKLLCAKMLEDNRTQLQHVLYYCRTDKTAHEMFEIQIKRFHSLAGWKDMVKKIELHINKTPMAKLEIEVYRTANQGE